MKLIRLTEDDFNHLAEKTDLGPDAREMARGFLVGRRSLLSIADEHGFSKQRVHLAVETIRKRYAKEKLTTGWMEVDVELPHQLALDIERLVAALTQQTDSKLSQAILDKVSRAIIAAEKTLAS
jgi:hypothetical protein